MEERGEMEKQDEMMLPGFRFHPTDEELVGFYLKRKIQQRSLPIELIRQLDIYKYDPWDLPKLATTGEKEWYFYCPRDRKYRNSARPNRVTCAGFWKATGTDRPIYSSDGAKCIGLKKSLVFYKGRAAKGIKTDWMMHEFRLPSLSDSFLPKRPLDKNIPANDSWAICRIFKKTNSMAQRALSHSLLPPLTMPNEPYLYSTSHTTKASQFSSENGSCTATDTTFNLQQHDSILSLPSLEIPTSFTFPQFEIPVSSSKCTMELASMILNLAPVVPVAASVDFGQTQQYHALTGDMNGIHANRDGQDMNILKTVGFPLDLPGNLSEEWRLSNLLWDSEIPTNYSLSKCYT